MTNPAPDEIKRYSLLEISGGVPPYFNAAAPDKFVFAADHDRVVAALTAELSTAHANANEWCAAWNARGHEIAALNERLQECQDVRNSWCKEYREQRDDANALVKRCALLEQRLREAERLALEVYPAVRDVLWCALVWNDHNFGYESIHQKLDSARKSLGIDRGNGVDAVNNWMEHIDAWLQREEGK